MKALKIYEKIDFQRGQDPKKSMGIGIAALIDSWFQNLYYGYEELIPPYRINDDGTIDLLESFDVPDRKIGEFPSYINFNICEGDFMLDYTELKSLRGCPKKVEGYFSCEGNRLMSLEGMPETILGDIFVRDNPGKFTMEDVLMHTKDLSGRKIYSENSHVDEGLEFNREGDPLDKLKVGKKNIIDLVGIKEQWTRFNPGRVLSEEEIIDILSNWGNRSSEELDYMTSSGILRVNDLDGKIVKYKGKYYQLPEYKDYGLTKDATVMYSFPKSPPSGEYEAIDLSGIDEGFKAKKVYEFVNFQRAGSDASAAEILKNAGVGRSVVTITWGKHRGKTVGDVFNEDPQYIVWLAKEGRPRPGQEAVFDEIHRLADKHLADLEKKREDEGYGFHYGRPGDIFEGPIEVRSARYYSGDYGSAYQIIGKYPPGQGQAKHWIRFYANLNILEKLFNLTGEEDSGYKLRDKMANLPGKIIDVKGKVTKHTEYKGQKTTNLNYVKFPKPITESIDFQRGKDPFDSLSLGIKGIIDIECRKVDLNDTTSVPILSPSGNTELGTLYQWTDATLANMVELKYYKDSDPQLFLYNSEEEYESVEGIDEIIDYAKRGKLFKFINLE